MTLDVDVEIDDLQGIVGSERIIAQVGGHVDGVDLSGEDWEVSGGVLVSRRTANSGSARGRLPW